MKKIGVKLLIGLLLSSANILNINGEKAEAAVSHLQITEVYYDTIGNDNVEEWVEIYNPTNFDIDLTGYKIGDEETKGGNEGMYMFPDEVVIGAGEMIVVARCAMGFYNLYHKFPDLEIDASDDNVTDFSNTANMTKYTGWASGSFSLTNTGDEILLLDLTDNVIDAVVFENGVFGTIVKHAGVNTGESLSRKDLDVDSDNCALDFETIYNPHPGYNYIYEAEDYFTNTGTMQADGTAERGLIMKAETDLTTAGYLFYGPYDDSIPEGMYQANFRLKIDDNTSTEKTAVIDAHNSSGDGNDEKIDIFGTDFANPDSWQIFTLWFERKNGGSMEFRVWFTDVIDISFDNVMISKVDRLIYESEAAWHQTGSEVVDATMTQGGGWIAQNGNETNYMIYGPYDALQSGGWIAKMVAKIDDNTATEKVAILNINNTFGTDEDKNLTIYGNDFDKVNSWQDFEINFAKSNNGLMEYRVFYLGQDNITVDYIIVSQLNKVIYEAENMYGSGHIVKDITASGGKIKKATTANDSEGWMMFGPYTKDQKEGQYSASFRMKVSDNTTDDMIAYVSCFNFGGSGTEEGFPLFANDFTAANNWQDINIDFTRTNDGLMEYRVYFTDIADVSVDYVEIIKN